MEKRSQKKIAEGILFSCLLLSALLHMPCRAQLALVWDLDGTLFKRSKQCAASAVGVWNAIGFYTKHGNQTEDIIERTLFDILGSAKDTGTEHAQVGTQKRTQKEDEVPRSASGRIAPALMQEWFIGTKTSTDMRTCVDKSLEQYDGFIDKTHKELMTKICDWMFDPEFYASCMRPAPRVGALLKECAQKRDADGSKHNKLYVLSNMDTDTFEALKNNRQNKPVFKYFNEENLFVSARMGDCKPHRSIYRDFLKRTGLKAEECILIDNQQENLVSARKCGFKVVSAHNGDPNAMRKELEKLGAL